MAPRVAPRPRVTVTRRDPESGLWTFIWRHRIGLAPILASTVIGLIGPVVRWIFGLPIEYAILVYLTAGGIAIAFSMVAIKEAGGPRWYVRRGRQYTALTVVLATAWLTWFHLAPATLDDLRLEYTTLWVVTGLVALPYWFDLRRRTRVKIDNELTAWPQITLGTALAGTRWVSFRKTATGWTGTLTGDRGVFSRRRVQNETELIESLMDAPPDSVTVRLLDGPGNVNKAEVTCVETDPHSDPVPWDGRPAKSIMDEVTLGPYADRSEEVTRWWTPGVGGYHRLIAGVTRSGKSGLMHLLVAKYGPAEDTAMWFIDLKGGTALLPWSPLGDWTATVRDEALKIVLAGAELVDARARKCARLGLEVHEPSVDDPVVLIFCDEIASLIGDSAPTSVSQPARAALVEIARKGAGMGVLLVLGTQYPTLAALGDSQLKTQLAWRACFRLSEPGQAQWILPNASRGVDPYRIPKERRGTCYIDAEGEFRHATLRVQFVDRHDIRPVVDKWWETTPEIAPESLRWKNKDLVEAYVNRRIWTPYMLDQLRRGGSIDGVDATAEDLLDLDDPDSDDDIMCVDDALNDQIDVENFGADGTVVAVDFTQYAGSEIRSAVTKTHADDPEAAAEDDRARAAWLAARRPVPNAQKAMEAAMVRAGEAGISPAELAATCNRSERTIHRWLENWRSDGRVTRLGWGRYRLTVLPPR